MQGHDPHLTQPPGTQSMKFGFFMSQSPHLRVIKRENSIQTLLRSESQPICSFRPFKSPGTKTVWRKKKKKSQIKDFREKPEVTAGSVTRSQLQHEAAPWIYGPAWINPGVGMRDFDRRDGSLHWFLYLNTNFSRIKKKINTANKGTKDMGTSRGEI